MSHIPVNLAVVFADVSGSTRLYEKLGDARALERIGLCLNIMREVTIEHGGRVIKTIGDEVMSVFPSAVAGVQATSDMQTRVSMQDAATGERLMIRIGVQFGPALERDGDIFGDSVNIAARMAELAKGGQIITTVETVQALPPSMRDLARHLDKVAVKGKEQDISICEILWQYNEDLTAMATHAESHGSAPTRLHLHYGNRDVILGPDQKVLTLGRDATCDLVIADRKASRQHARIERRRGKIVLIDQSTNGTYVSMEGQPESALKREETVLRARGSISFGHRQSADSTDLLHFEVEG